MNCRHCHSPLSLPLVDLGTAPPSNAYMDSRKLHGPESWFPLRVLVCEQCWLVQTEDFTQADSLFDADYAYFSGFSTSWLDHCRRYSGEMIERFQLNSQSRVVEVAANDGYLLQYFKAAGIPCTGVEPTASTAAAARAKGIEIVQEFFGTGLAQQLVSQGKAADLMAANNVLAHVPDINDFVRAFALLLKPEGVATFEFPHLLRLVQENQFDTIYHEHFSYLSLTSATRIFQANGLEIFDMQELPTHGGSLRVFAQRQGEGKNSVTQRCSELLERESAAGMTSPQFYRQFQTRTDKVKNDFLSFLLQAHREGRAVGAYGAAAKGNTLLNYAGVRADLLPFVADRNPAKQGKFLPGSRIPIRDEEFLRTSRPDYVVIFPWNLREELFQQLEYVREWKGRFVTAVPELAIH